MMIDKHQQEIKERLQRYAMDLWEISDPRQIDPVVDLMLDVFSYNSSRLSQEIESSDTAILHRLSRLLVPQKWSLPFPAHALMTANPINSSCRRLTGKDSFYTDKMVFEKGLVRLNFTPLSNYPLAMARVKCMVSGQNSVLYTDDGRQIPSRIPGGNEDEGTIWIGIEATDNTLQELDKLILCIIPEDERLVSFVKEVSAYDMEGNMMDICTPSFHLDDDKKYHYFNEIADYYSDHFISIDFAGHTNRENLKNSIFPQRQNVAETEQDNEKLCWIKLTFPYMFSNADFMGMRILTNTYPVVNRQIVNKKHSFVRQGSIIPISCDNDSLFLNMEELQDDTGKKYTDITEHYEEFPEAAFSLYFGHLEKFDSDNARSLVIRLMQLIREDINAFQPIDVATFSSQLNEISQKLDEIEQSVYDAVHAKAKSRVFLLTNPFKGTSDVDLNYWITNGAIANGLDYRTPLYQLNSVNQQNQQTTGLCFQTVTKGGRMRNSEQELINSLRYGLLSKERIVTQEDVRSFIMHKVGAIVSDVDIKDGIVISSDVHKGIVRTTEVRIKIRSRANVNPTDYTKTALFLEKELSRRSISNTPYKIFFE
ncbi:MAG: hypothetical protein SPI30_10295 [Prevotella sp.]|nr:hypothetical protein [Prevotella sp.]